MRSPSAARALAAGFALALAVPGATQTRTPSTMLARLEAGRWELRGPANERLGALCLGNPLVLVQPRHGGANCARDVVAADAASMTVNYSCPGVGRGRTTLRFETPRLVQIDSQGIDRGLPFAMRAEARRVGACG